MPEDALGFVRRECSSCHRQWKTKAWASDAPAIPLGPLLAVAISKVFSVPLVARRPILFASVMVNHSPPSVPTVISVGDSSTLNSDITPAVVMRPMALPSTSVYHIAPSGPRVMERGNFGDPGMLCKRMHWTGPLDHLDAHASSQEHLRLSRLYHCVQQQAKALVMSNGLANARE